jgi:hypothetical protein
MTDDSEPSDQGNLGTCAVHAVVGVIADMIEERYGKCICEKTQGEIRGVLKTALASGANGFFTDGGVQVERVAECFSKKASNKGIIPVNKKAYKNWTANIMEPGGEALSVTLETISLNVWQLAALLSKFPGRRRAVCSIKTDVRTILLLKT